MKLKEEFKGYPKETMYSVYCSIVYQPKDSKKNI